ncbi:MAG: FecR domain-containing protein, partial [Lachnospiraceae bacterium]|nr:FecR domain-containing protein [Lachnospiraceae bacterium]
MKMKRRGMLQRVLMLLLLVCLICGNGLMALADEAVASSMRLTKTEGTVSVTNKNGRDMGTMADMKLFNGYSLATAQASYAWMNLDDHKLVKLDAISEAEIQKKGKNLEVLLNSGNLLFNVSENLKSDETLNIRTSTMVTGIRGTCGWVKVVDSSRTQVYILEGQVVCYVMDPVTGQSKSITLHSGEMAEFVVYDQTRVGDKCDIIINRFDEKQIDGFVAVELMNDSELRDRITSVLNIDMSWIVTNAPSILAQNQTAAAAKFAAVNEAAKQQTSKVVKDPVFGNDDDDDDNGSGSGGGSSVTQPSDPTDPTDPTNPTDPTDPTDPTEPETEPTGLTEITLTVAEAEADDQLNFYLSMDTMKDVTIVAADGDATLDITTITTISDGQTVTLDGVDLVIAESGELRINGELTVPTNVTNKGTISNTSLNSFIVGGTLIN